MSSFIIALRSELFVTTRSLAARLVILVPSLIVIAQLTLLKISNLSAQAQSAMLGQQSSSDNMANNAYGFFVDGLSTGLTLVFLTMTTYAAFSFANDRDTGVVRNLVIRRISRPALLLAKLCTFHLVAIVSVFTLFVACYVLSNVYWDFGPVVEDGYELIGVEDIQTEIILGLKLALIPLPAALGIGLLISVSVQSATQAVTAALGATLGLDILKGMFGDFAQYFYFYYQPSLIDQSYLSDVSRLVRGYSDVLIDERLLQLNFMVPLPEMLIFIVLAILLVKRRSL